MSLAAKLAERRKRRRLAASAREASARRADSLRRSNIGPSRSCRNRGSPVRQARGSRALAARRCSGDRVLARRDHARQPPARSRELVVDVRGGARARRPVRVARRRGRAAGANDRHRHRSSGCLLGVHGRPRRANVSAAMAGERRDGATARRRARGGAASLRATTAIAAWREDMPWLTLYFSAGVWLSIALVEVPPLATRRASRAWGARVYALASGNDRIGYGSARASRHRAEVHIGFRRSFGASR